MKRLSVALVAILGLGFFMEVAAAEEQNPREALERLRESVRSEVLSNGIKVTLYKRGYAPVFAGVVAVRVGGVNEEEGQTGVSHLFEHMAFKGTSEIGTKDYEKERILLAEFETLMQKKVQEEKLSTAQEEKLEELSRSLEELISPEEVSAQLSKRGASGLNATTSTELTTYFVSLPKTAFEFWAWLESGRILKPVMRQFYQERAVVMEERRMRVEDDPVGKLYEELLGTAYKTHPYRNPVIGYQRDLDKLTATMTAEFHSKYYVGENISVSVVGDLDFDAVLSTLERYFGRIPRGPKPDHTKEPEAPQTEERRVVVTRKASPVVFLAYHKPSYPDPRDSKISLLEEILAGSVVSPLYKRLVLQEKIATSVGVYEAPGNAYPNLVIFQIIPRHPHTADEAVEAFDRELGKIMEVGISEEQVAIAKRSLLVEHLGDMKSNMSLARQFATSQLLYGAWDASLDWLEQVVSLEPSEVLVEAQRILKRDNRTVGILQTEAS